MQTFKTAVVVVLLLGVCYGAYVALNAPEPTLPESLKDWNEDALALDIENGAAVDIPQLNQTPPPSGLEGLTPPKVAAPSATPSPTLSLPPSPSLAEAPASQTPDILTPPTLGNAASNKNNLDAPELPDLSAAKEGDAVPLPALPGFPESEPTTPKPGSALTSTTKLDAPPSISMPLPPGQTEPPAATPSSDLANSFPTPGLLNNSSEQSTNGSTGVALMNSGPQKSTSKTAQPFKDVREQAIKLANEGKLREALAMLSPYFNHIELTHEEQIDLKDLLDALAGEVIYSKRHFLESKYIVSPGETLESIANKYRVSPEALANINRLGESKIVLAGTELKVLNGPFRAEVALGNNELTLFLGDLYAGRFAVSIGTEPSPTEGTYTIVERRRDRSYVGPDSKFIEAKDPRNPYGGYWMHLGNNLSIHGSPESAAPEAVTAGCISLAPLDAKEVYTLLTQGSEVTIKR